MNWFLTLPLFLDLPDLRVVHACWHAAALDFLRPYLTADDCMTLETLILATREPDDDAEKDTPEMTAFKAVEAVLKGVEAPLPAPYTFNDKDGHERDRVRIRWWDNDATDFRRAAMLPLDERAAFPEAPVPPHALIGHDGGKPVFVGHYWLAGVPAPFGQGCLRRLQRGQREASWWPTAGMGEATLDERKFHCVRS